VAIAKQESQPALMHVNFGQRTAQRETKAFDDLCNHYRLERRKVIDLPFFAEFGGNSLVDRRMEIEDALAIEPGSASTFVTGLIPTILDLAHAWAASISARRVYIGVSEALGSPGPATGQIYPDYRREFYQRYNYMLNTCLRPRSELEVVTPLIDLSAADIVRLAQRLEAPLELTWSCYRGDKRPCGSCYPCAVRARGFAEAGLPDPLMLQPVG
jgi:7-cyano-7-deazaguanine synthase